MAECAASPSCIRLPQIYRRFLFRPKSQLRAAPSRKWVSICKMRKLGASTFSTLGVRPVRNACSRSCYLGSVVDADNLTLSEFIPVGDQVLLMASIFLTYLAGITPLNLPSTSQKSMSNEDFFSKSSTSPGSNKKNADQVNFNCAWDVVRGKLLDSLDYIKHRSNVGCEVHDSERNWAKRPLSLYAISEGPRIRLLWLVFQQLQEEVNKVVDTSNTDDWSTVPLGVIQKSCKPACYAWLDKELHTEKSRMGLISLLNEKLNEDDSIFENIRKSGKEYLFVELLYFLRFGSLRSGCCYDNNLFTLHGESILEDLVITLADGIASIYLELISVDGNLTDDMNNMGLSICSLSTRALQRLRNEVALNQWLYQNLEAVVSMYEDRFDLFRLVGKRIENNSNDEAESYSWWKKLMPRQHASVSFSSLYYVISQFSMPVKRTKELRALTGWRYYFSLFLEFSDISMPMVRTVLNKVSDAISFFLVCLIGRSLGLIYTGIRQSLRWK